VTDTADSSLAAVAAGACAASPPPGTRPLYRGRLFRRYLVLILTLVTIALLASGAISVYFTYQETKASLASLQHEKAVAAASRIEQYILQIERQLAYAALPQLEQGNVEARRIEFLKLLRQAPEVTDVAQIGPDGRERVAVSRLGMDSLDSGKDRSQEPAFREARAGEAWFGPVYFRKETEPYMTMALRAGSDKGAVTVAEINLKFIWDVVSRIGIGGKGKAYVVDDKGYLVADPDIALVLRKTNLSDLRHVAAAANRQASDALAMVSEDRSGTPILASVAPIVPLKWNVFVERPVAEVYAKLDAAIVRTALLLLAGLALSALGALALARGMVRPIRTLDESAERIGAGDLEQNIDVHTGDELEALAGQFNRMTGRLRESYAGLERKVDERTRELRNALEQQTAISEILRVISGSPTDVAPVLQAVAERAAHLCDAPFARVMVIHEAMLSSLGEYSADPVLPSKPVPVSRTSVTGRAVMDRAIVHIADIAPIAASEFPDAVENIRSLGCRAVLGVPLLREGGASGAIFVFRREPGLFAADQVALVQTFARQAAIAIDNVRLFNETKEALERQTAMSEILRVISGSPTDVRPVFDTIAAAALRLCDASSALVFTFDGELIHLAASANLNADSANAWRRSFPRPPSRDTAAARAVLTGEVVMIPDVLEDPEYAIGPTAVATGFRSALAIPLIRDGKPIGVIGVGRPEPGPFRDHQMTLLQTFADQAVIAIENVRLFNETREALEQQTAVAEILRVISSSPTDVQPVLDAIAERAATLCDASAASMYLLDGDLLRHLASKGPSPDPVSHVDALAITRESISGRVFLEQRPIQVRDMLAAGNDYPASRELAQRFQHRTVLVVPLLREGKAFGTVLLRRREVRPFSEREMALLRTFADQAAIALENVRLFREIEDKGRQLEIANKHKSEFLANMSHELRTPLNAIIGFSEVLLERLFGELNAKQDDYLKDIHSSGRHLLSLINDILDLSKIEAGRMELDTSHVDVASALANALSLVRERAQQHRITIAQDVDPLLGEIEADERKFKQILLNLLSNAVKFTPDGGRIDVGARRSGDCAEFAVRDSGIGIAPEDQAAVFEEFRQVGRDYTKKQEGTGLGLALTRKFVELHGGRIWLESTPGAGSTFTFTIPLVP